MASLSGMRITRAGIIFIVVVVALAALLFGGLYFAQQRGEQVRRDEAAEIARQNLENDSNQPVVIGEDEGVSNGVVDDDRTDEQTDGGATPAQLPETGGELTSLIAVFGITLAATAYIQSRRAAQQL